MVDYVANSMKEVQEQLVHHKVRCNFQLSLKIKFFFSYQKSQSKLVNLIFMQIEEDFKEMRFGLPEQ